MRLRSALALAWHFRENRIRAAEPASTLDKLLAQAQGYAEFAMRNIGHVPPALLAESPTGLIHFIPDSLKDERAKDNFANTARLICVGYEARLRSSCWKPG